MTEISQQQTELAPSDPTNLLRIALQNDADLERLEKLMELQEKWNKEQAKKAFYEAKSGFMGEKPAIPRTKKSHNNTYAPLGIIQVNIDPIVSKWGFSYRWTKEQNDNSMTVNCIITHKEGHSEVTSMTGPYDDSGKKSRIHSIGSSDTYLKRYTLTSGFGLTVDDDDDGNGTQGKKEALKLPKMSTPKFKELLPKVTKGELTLKRIEEVYSITEIQRDSFKSLEESKPKES